MSIHRLFRWIRRLLKWGFLALMGLAVCLIVPGREYFRESGFRDRFGDAWRYEYERHLGPVTDARIRAVLAFVGSLIILAILAVLVRYLRKEPHESIGRVKARRHMKGSTAERIVRCHRNTFLGNYLGLGGMMAGILIAVFRWDIFADRANEVVLGIVVYLGGYAGVVGGCWWWLKAKAWMEAVVFVAFVPLAAFFVPFVRSMFLATPAVVMPATVILPVALMAVVFALPDRSGMNRRQTAQDLPSTAGPH